MEHPRAVVFHVLLLELAHHVHRARVEVDDGCVLVIQVSEMIFDWMQSMSLAGTYTMSGSERPMKPLLTIALLVLFVVVAKHRMFRVACCAFAYQPSHA